MKRKLFSVAMAVVITVACLTGCSGNFSKSSFISAAKSSGMKEIKETTELSNILADPGEHIAFYYDMDIKLFEFLGGSLRDYASVKDVKECTMAIESIGETEDHGRCLTQIYFLTFKDSETAEEIYESAVKPLRYGVEEGKKNGVTIPSAIRVPKTHRMTVQLLSLHAAYI